MVRRVQGLILLFFFIGGCASGMAIDVMRYEPEARPRKPRSFSVELMHRGAVPGPFKIIGRVTVETGEDHDPNRVLMEIEKTVRKMGGDALLDYTVIVQLAHGGIPTGRVKYTADVIVLENRGATPK
jgi:hypothetical protein